MNKENNIVLVAVILLLVLLAFGGCFGTYKIMNGIYGGFSFMWIFGWLIMILVVIVFVLFILWLIKQLTGNERRAK